MFTSTHTKPAATLAILVGAALAMSAAPTPATAATPTQAAATVAAQATMPTKQAAKVKIRHGKVKVTGTVRVGKKLTFKVSGFTASPKPSGLKYTYKVYRSGKTKAVYSKTTTATKVKYSVKQADKGHKITVKVTARPTGKGKAGFRNGTAKVTTKVVGKKLASTNKAATNPSASTWKRGADGKIDPWAGIPVESKQAKAARTTKASPGVYWVLDGAMGNWDLMSCTVLDNGHSTPVSTRTFAMTSSTAKRYVDAKGNVISGSHPGKYLSYDEFWRTCVN
ncbi:MAG: hypothetical protein LBH13_08515 [Cellulomonadaceae bacterium]|jgi:hypothetical protein|nr:hypothetical protein [Cellulomonadaceae bacterium]